MFIVHYYHFFRFLKHELFFILIYMLQNKFAFLVLGFGIPYKINVLPNVGVKIKIKIINILESLVVLRYLPGFKNNILFNY